MSVLALDTWYIVLQRIIQTLTMQLNFVKERETHVHQNLCRVIVISLVAPVKHVG